ncbi:MAG: hypothetical protein JWM35_2777 [Verrucomicrobia bacterium]|nr:hypothetical protein [Verrucomicrobiota bacterium]
MALAWHHSFILGTSVWLAYAADRWIEGWWLKPEQVRTQRHFFYQRWRWPLAAWWTAMLVADVTVSVRNLTSREFNAGLLLLVPVFAYLLSHQLIHRLRRWRAPKEICVALLFSAGVSVFLLPEPSSGLITLALPLLLFALLCFANCALISVWEQAVDQAHGQTSLALQFDRARTFARVLPWIIAVAATGFAASHVGPARTAGGCAAWSGILLGALDLTVGRGNPRLARALVDFALMTPAAVLIFERWFF